MAKPNTGVVAALGRGKAQRNHVPTLNEMFEAICRGPFPGVKGTENFGKHEHNAEFVCTACGRSVDIVKVRAHPVLQVGICKDCYNFQVSDPFTKDNPQDPFWHENECRWCGNSGDVILCDSCPKAVCKHCIKRNFGEEILNAIASPIQKWSCFVCHGDHLQILIRDHLQTLICDYSNLENLVKTMNKSSEPQKSRMSRFMGDCASSDEEKNNNHLSFYQILKASNIGRSNRDLVRSNSGQFGLPKKFMDIYGERVQKNFMSTNNKQVHVKFQGINKDSPIYDLTCQKRWSKTKWRADFRPSQWSRFVKDNSLKKGHTLQFSLVANSYFVVRKV